MDMGYLISPSARSPTEPPVSAVSFADGDTLPQTLPNPSIPPSLPITTLATSNNHNELTLKRPSNPLPSVLVSPTDEASSILISLAATPPAAAVGQSVSIDCESHGVKRPFSSLADAVSPSDHFYSQSASNSGNYSHHPSSSSSSTDKGHVGSINDTTTDAASKRLRHFSEDKMSLSYSNDFSVQPPPNRPAEFPTEFSNHSKNPTAGAFS
ncbi:hypothetical protein HDU81_010924 [Chytriomyces hyalinus]|nr:hypothetical protein HDU81_010924 [Chytriomyces hyalinus]